MHQRRDAACVRVTVYVQIATAALPEPERAARNRYRLFSVHRHLRTPAECRSADRLPLPNGFFVIYFSLTDADKKAQKLNEIAV